MNYLNRTKLFNVLIATHTIPTVSVNLVPQPAKHYTNAGIVMNHLITLNVIDFVITLIRTGAHQMELTDQLDSISNQAMQNFSSLNADQLNWKPAAEKWSIAQCLDHLIIANSKFIPLFDDILQKGYHPTWWQRLSPFSAFFGKSMVKTLGPVPKRKFKAPKIFKPASSNIHLEILDQFQKQQQDLKARFIALIDIKPEKIIMRSPVTKLVTYSVQHALELIAGHEQRHINQALAVLHHPNFPK
jgi:uncharacterized damage-inducible protein DinB